MLKIKTGSDYSGVGAFDQALDRLGVEQNKIFACDMDRYARQSYIANYGEPAYYPKNVYDREIPKDPLDIYMTSPPCQAFSLAGKRKGEKDKRGILFYNSHEFIKKNKPRSFIFENVKGLLSHDKRDKNHEFGQTFNRWLAYLGGKSINGNPVVFPHPESVPYHIYYRVLNAKDYGIPQNRERIFIIGIRDDEDNNFKWPKPFPLEKRLLDVLETNVDEKYFLSEKLISYFIENNKKNKLKGNGFKYIPKGEKDIANCITARVAKMGVDDNYIKIKSATKTGYELATVNDSINFSVPKSETRRGRVGKGVAQTLDTACNQGVLIQGGRIIGRNPENPKSRKAGLITKQTIEINENPSVCNTLSTVQKDNIVLLGYRVRRLTPRECMRLMDFPDTYKIEVSDTQAYKQAGNSICVGVLAAIIAKLPFINVGS